MNLSPPCVSLMHGLSPLVVDGGGVRGRVHWREEGHLMEQPHVDSFLTTPTTGLEVHYRDWGGPTGGMQPPVLLLHGLASTCRIYDLCAPLLAQGRRVVAYDQRGHGATGKPDSGYDAETLVADGMGVAQALGVTPPFIVVGHSWGASVALHWAVSRPDVVHAGVLVDGGVSTFRDIPGATWQTVEERFGPPAWQDVHLDDMLAWARKGDLSTLDESFRRDFLTALTVERPDGTVRAQLSADNHWRILRSMWAEDTDAAFKALRRPVLALLALPAPPWDDARQDMIDTRRKVAEQRTALQPLLHVRWLEDTIHDIPLQRPAVLAEAIEGV